MTRSIAYVDSLQALARALARMPDAAIVTDNPLLANDRRAGGDVIDISTRLGQPEATALGNAAIDHLLFLDRVFAEEGAAARYGGRPAALNITLAMRALWSSLIHRGSMMARFLQDWPPAEVVLFVVDEPRWEAVHPWAMPRFSCPFRALGEAGFFGSIVPRVEVVAADLPDDPANSSGQDAWLRVLLFPVPMLIHEVVKRLGVDRWLPRRGIAVAKPSEALRETLPWLLLRGYRPAHFNPPAYAGREAPGWDLDVEIDPWLTKTVGEVLGDGLRSLGIFEEQQAKAVLTVTLTHLTAGLGSLKGTVKRIDDSITHSFGAPSQPKAKPRQMLLTSGIYGPAGVQLHAACRDRNIKLVGFEHGATTGLALTADRRVNVSEATHCDRLVVSSSGAADAFGRAAGKSGSDIAVAGLPDQTRKTLRRPLQRWRARKRLGLSGRDIAVVHVSTLLYGGNMRPGDDNPVESYVYATEKSLITSAYAGIGKPVLFKGYPAQRNVHHAEPSDMYDLPDNLRLVSREDFRYLRAAADIIVTDASYSTIGWCVGADVPLVHLGSRKVLALASDELRTRFEASFLTVDMDRDDWAARLRAIVSRPQGDLRGEWDRKRPARATLLRENIAGPGGTMGRVAAREVLREYA